MSSDKQLIKASIIREVQSRESACSVDHLRKVLGGLISTTEILDLLKELQKQKYLTLRSVRGQQAGGWKVEKLRT